MLSPITETLLTLSAYADSGVISNNDININAAVIMVFLNSFILSYPL